MVLRPCCILVYNHRLLTSNRQGQWRVLGWMGCPLGMVGKEEWGWLAFVLVCLFRLDWMERSVDTGYGY